MIGGTDCGFGTFVGWSGCDPNAAWLKLKSLADGARMASDKLWGRRARGITQSRTKLREDGMSTEGNDRAVVDRRELLVGTTALAGALALPGVSFGQGTPRRGGTLRLAMPYNPAALDPMTGRNLPDFNVLYAVFDALIDFVPKTLELKPGLAKSWKFTDPKTLVLDLVEGVKFHDGTPFNAEAVKFNLERYKTDPRSNVKADLDTVESVEVDRQEPGHAQAQPAERRPADHPDQPHRPDGLAANRSRTRAATSTASPVGTGPFKFVELAGQQQLHAGAQRELLEGRACPISTASTSRSSTS